MVKTSPTWTIGQGWVFNSIATPGNTLYNRHIVEAATLLADADISQTLT